MGRVYTTVQGDTWDIISLKVYGSESYAHIILDENLSLGHIIFFDAGTEILIPDIDDSDSNDTNVNLPPWRL